MDQDTAGTIVIKLIKCLLLKELLLNTISVYQNVCSRLSNIFYGNFCLTRDINTNYLYCNGTYVCNDACNLIGIAYNFVAILVENNNRFFTFF